ncbi:M23 family metallopeptidase [Microbacterium imperiale]|nr:M23 family metallopeptidase [Microbacterium imperiale]
MAEHNDSSVDVPEVDATNPDHTGRALNARRRFPMAKKQSRELATADNRATRRRRGTVHPVRSTFTVAAVVGLVATVAIPAFAAVRSTSAEAMTLQQVAADNAQSLVVGSESTPAALDRSGFTATTPEEIQKKKDEEAAAKAAAEALANRISASSSTASSSTVNNSIPLVAPGSGLVRRPLMSFNNFGTPYAGHRGTDYMADRGTPIYSVADGTVVASSESGPGWGVYVKVAHNINGTNVTSLYAHMDWGTRAVQVGDTVSAGQLLGQVGDTGRAFGTHLHLEIVIDGTYVNAESWLVANAG